MLKIIIELDETKIRLTNQYRIDELKSTLDKIFSDNGLLKKSDTEYIDNGNEKDFANFWFVILSLAQTDWFMKYTKTWQWCNSDESDNPEDFITEDLLEHYKNKQRRGA